MNLHVLPNVEFVVIIFYSFGLWMFRSGMDTFALVSNYLEKKYKIHIWLYAYSVNVHELIFKQSHMGASMVKGPTPNFFLQGQ
jgi:hypothetical protein